MPTLCLVSCKEPQDRVRFGKRFHTAGNFAAEKDIILNVVMSEILRDIFYVIILHFKGLNDKILPRVCNVSHNINQKSMIR